MAIRKMKKEDSQGMLEFFRELVIVDQERVERSSDVARIDLATEETWIESRIKKEEEKEMAALVLEREGKIVAEGEIERLQRWIERHVAEIRFGMLPGNEDEYLYFYKIPYRCRVCHNGF